MAKFQDSKRQDFISAPPAGAESQPIALKSEQSVHDRSIGDIIRELRNLSTEQVEEVLAYQRQNGVRFGEAAIALRLASSEDVLYALSKQFHYPYAPEEQRKLNPELVALNQPFSYQSESFRGIRSQMMMRLFADEHVRHSVAITSPDSGDGKTFFAANLAVMFAQLGGRTLLVDADMRSPRQHEVFNISNTVGLSGILAGRAEAHVIQQVPAVPSLFVITVGATPPNPLELVERPAFGLLMRELTAKFDHVIVDTPAAVFGSDAAVIAARCGAALVVARKNASRLGALQDLVGSLGSAGSKVAGVIVNDY